MGRYIQILLTATPAACLDPDTIVNGEVTHFFYGPEGWVEKWSGGSQGYRLISQRAVDADTIMQIAEVMNDGWVPSQIYMKDVACVQTLAGGQGFKEGQIGFWNRRIMDIEMPEPAVKPTAVPRDTQKVARPPQQQQQRSLLGAAPRLQHQPHPHRPHRPNYQIRLASEKCLISVSPLKA
jgi:hypothetical protein